MDNYQDLRVVVAEITKAGLEWLPVEVNRIKLDFKEDQCTLGFKYIVSKCRIWLEDGSILAGYVRVEKDNKLIFMGQTEVPEKNE